MDQALERCQTRIEELEIVLEAADRLLRAQERLDREPGSAKHKRTVTARSKAYSAVRDVFIEEKAETREDNIDPMRVTAGN